MESVEMWKSGDVIVTRVGPMLLLEKKAFWLLTGRFVASSLKCPVCCIDGDVFLFNIFDEVEKRTERTC